MTPEEIFADRLKILLTLKRVSQKEIAVAINSSQSSISEYLSGKKIPTTKKLIAIANYFSVSTAYLLGEIAEFKNKNTTIYFSSPKNAVQIMQLSENEEDHWKRMGATLLTGIIYFLKEQNIPTSVDDLSVYLSNNHTEALLQDMLHSTSPDVITVAEKMLSLTEQEYNGIVSTIKSYLTHWLSLEIIRRENPRLYEECINKQIAKNVLLTNSQNGGGKIDRKRSYPHIK